MGFNKTFITLFISFMMLLAFSTQQCAFSQLSSEELGVVNDTLSSVDGAVDETQKKIKDVELKLKKARDVIKHMRLEGKISKQTSLSLLQNITEAEYALNMTKGPLKGYSKYYGKVGKVTELYNDIKGIQNAYTSNNTYLGQTGGGLAVLTKLADKFGDKIPVPGLKEVIMAYSDVTKKLLDKTVQASKDIQKYHNQNMIGGSTYNAGADRAKQEIFLRDFPRHASNYHYIPTSPYYLYEAMEGPYVRFIWDEKAQKFYPVEPDVPVTMIHRFNLLLDRDMTPEKLKQFSDKWNRIGQPRFNASNQLADLFNAHNKKNLPHLQKMAIMEIREKYFDELSISTTDRETFIARYIFDKAFKDKVDSSLKDLYAKAASDPRLKGFADYIYKFSKQNNIFITYVPSEQERRTYNPPPRIPEVQKPVNRPPQRSQPQQPPQVSNNNIQRRPPATNDIRIKQAATKLSKDRKNAAICKAYMTAVTQHYADYQPKDGSKYTVEFARPYTYIDGMCVGSHNLRRHVPGKESYIEVRNGSPSAPMKYYPSALEAGWKKKFPNAGWPD